VTTKRYKLSRRDCIRVLSLLESDSVDSIVTDPPYGINFKEEDWDSAVPGVAVWEQCLRVLKPGGYLLAFGAPRTYHRLAVAIEDAGWEIKDCLMWLYGSGFSRGTTRLKPGYEPIVLAKKPTRLTVAQCLATYGTGELNIEASRTAAGRRPANVILDEEAASLLDDQSGERKSAYPGKEEAAVSYAGSKVNDTSTFWSHGTSGKSYSDSGGASRFFYCPKASVTEREEGLGGNGKKDRKNTHTTVKPISLMRYLTRLVTPQGGQVLDPFMGSGTTGIASILEDFRFHGIEKNSEYYDIAKRRMIYFREKLKGNNA